MLKNLKIDVNTHKLLKDYCMTNRLKLNDFASYIIEKYIGEMKCGEIVPTVGKKSPTKHPEDMNTQ